MDKATKHGSDPEPKKTGTVIIDFANGEGREWAIEDLEWFGPKDGWYQLNLKSGMAALYPAHRIRCVRVTPHSQEWQEWNERQTRRIIDELAGM